MTIKKRPRTWREVLAEMAEWPNAPALRAGVERLREFESRSLRLKLLKDHLCQKKNQSLLLMIS